MHVCKDGKERRFEDMELVEDLILVVPVCPDCGVRSTPDDPARDHRKRDAKEKCPNFPDPCDHFHEVEE